MTNTERLARRIDRLTAAIALYEMTDCAYTKIRLGAIIKAMNCEG